MIDKDQELKQEESIKVLDFATDLQYLVDLEKKIQVSHLSGMEYHFMKFEVLSIMTELKNIQNKYQKLIEKYEKSISE